MTTRHPPGGLAVAIGLYRAVLVGLLIAIALLIAVAVLFRYGLGAPILYSYELASLLFVWLVFLSLAGGAAQAAHLGADILTPYLGPNALRLLQILAHACSLAVLAYISWYAWVLAGRTRVEMPTLGLSMAWMYAAVPAGSALYMGWIVYDLARLVGVVRAPAPTPLEV
ncbi:TRAP transporter small permease [Bosea sp. BK604]|uniref:TRAP transporter small permease n=1 Tax=Bosea sp. BK604 TaxID=2512180 RepID=UPI0010511031|nr:TRAP transporter small permease [Bosea sp. BK604]TCR63129.1 TRAP-type C4-dicarboxylate transport system permease small subunit [Bosea sp. BK604]